MKFRCLNPRNKRWNRYGGRGIKVCQRWLDSYENFLEDMGRRPSSKYSLDRRDNDGPYSPENCRWATLSEQARNRVNTHMLSYLGETLSEAEWADRTGIKLSTISSRIMQGWPVELALTLPADRESVRLRQTRLLTFDGATLSVNGWGERLGISPNTIQFRIQQGWSVERVLSTKDQRMR